MKTTLVLCDFAGTIDNLTEDTALLLKERFSSIIETNGSDDIVIRIVSGAEYDELEPYERMLRKIETDQFSVQGSLSQVYSKYNFLINLLPQLTFYSDDPEEEVISQIFYIEDRMDRKIYDGTLEKQISKEISFYTFQLLDLDNNKDSEKHFFTRKSGVNGFIELLDRYIGNFSLESSKSDSNCRTRKIVL